MANNCLVCDSPLAEAPQAVGVPVYNCPRCGAWSLNPVLNAVSNGLRSKLGEWDRRSVHLRSHLSHILRRQQRPGAGWVEVPFEIETWKLDQPLPGPREQLDRLVVAIGDAQPSPAESAHVHPAALSAVIGSAITRQSPNAGLGWLLEQTDASEMIEHRGEHGDAVLLRLRIKGWSRYDALKRQHVESRTALMAMKFGDKELDGVVDEIFRPAVKRAGFELRIITDKQGAGLIDDQLRVALRTSRFVIADLTHGNNGAYWEAGFAEGLGRPVIYTCRKAEWDDQAKKPHFDTNHLVTIIWTPVNLAVAADRLTATIRATLPGEANLSD